jgi:hypothetical protein
MEYDFAGRPLTRVYVSMGINDEDEAVSGVLCEWCAGHRMLLVCLVVLSAGRPKMKL